MRNKKVNKENNLDKGKTREKRKYKKERCNIGTDNEKKEYENQRQMRKDIKERRKRIKRIR